MELVIIWIVLSFVVAYIATTKARSGFGFFLLSALLSPLIGLIVVAIVPRKQTAQKAG